jgi:hypothetical protein
MARHAENTKEPVAYDARFDEYSIQVPGGASRQLLWYCPWCGERLPRSRRDEWFDALEARGIDPIDDPIPEPFQSDAWWRDGEDI